MSQVNVLLIENQYLQFRNIRKKLEEILDSPYKIYPEESIDDDKADLENFMKFMDNIRIALNPRYDKYCDDAWTKVQEYIADVKPGIFIIDHKLVGNDEGQTGIDLARRFWAEAKYPQPVLFLSRTPDSKKEVVEKLDGYYHPHRWLYKGYSDHEILDKEYFDSRVHPTIQSLLKLSKEKTAYEEVQLRLSGLFYNPLLDTVLDQKDRIYLMDGIKKIKNLTAEEDKKIKEYKSLDFKKTNAQTIRDFFHTTLTDIIKRHGE